MRRTMWLATKQRGRWVKAHSSADGGLSGYSERLDLLNGGVSIRSSAASHLERTLTWNRVTAAEAREITDFAHGVHGDGPYYLVDPDASRQNALDKQWSTPALTGKDGVPLWGDAFPNLVTNNDATNGYPLQMAQYQVKPTGSYRTFYTPVPPGYTAWLGVHGDETSTGGVTVQPLDGIYTIGAPTVASVTSCSAPRFSDSFPATGDNPGIEISLRNDTGADTTVTIAGMVLQILPNGVTPDDGGFISGQGMTGFQFEGKPQVTPYSYHHGSYGVTAKIVEVETWL